jgi:hypothetical protein
MIAGKGQYVAMHEPLLSPPRSAGSQVDLSGDARIIITAPFYLDNDPLVARAPWTLPGGEDMDGEGLISRQELPLQSRLFQGTLTYYHPQVDGLDILGTFVGSDTLHEQLRMRMRNFMTEQTGQTHLENIDVVGLLFPDGYGSIAVTCHFPAGWEPPHRRATLQSVGQQGRDAFAAEIREALLPPLGRLVKRCGARDPLLLPYFNLTYAGNTTHPRPGRATLSDHLRNLVYPNSPDPLPSGSPWSDEYLFAGYAYLVLATAHERPSAEKLTLLLLILNVSYARVARAAGAGDAELRRAEHTAVDSTSLAALEYRLRADYQSLINPVFSYDHHALRMRDAILRSWEADNLQARMENVLAGVRQSIERSLANEQGRRLHLTNTVIVVLTMLSLVSTFQAGLEIYDRFLK